MTFFTVTVPAAAGNFLALHHCPLAFHRDELPRRFATHWQACWKRRHCWAAAAIGVAAGKFLHAKKVVVGRGSRIGFTAFQPLREFSFAASSVTEPNDASRPLSN
jgi:hypothetical protein